MSTLTGRLLVLVLTVALMAAVSPGLAAARPTPLLPKKPKAKPVAAPSCSVFTGAVSALELGALKGPSLTNLGGHHTICSWSGQQQGKYAFVVTVAVFPAPSFLARALINAAKTAELKASRGGHGLGFFVTKSPRRGNYFESLALYSEEQKNSDTGTCPPILNEEGVEIGAKTAVEQGQSSPQCIGQPGTEGIFLTAYGSPRPNYQPMLLQISVASQVDASRGILAVKQIASRAYAGHF